MKNKNRIMQENNHTEWKKIEYNNLLSWKFQNCAEATITPQSTETRMTFMNFYSQVHEN